MAALSEIEKLEARWAENPDGRYFAPLADAYRKAGRIDDAIAVVTAGLTKHPDYLSAHIVLGRCHLEKKDDASARGAFERVLTLDSENIIALKSLAEIAERQGATDDARRWLQRLLTIDAMNTEAADDLQRLGGPLPDEGAEAAPEPVAEAEDVRISFADVAPEAPAIAEETTQPMAVDDVMAVPKTLERLAITPEMAKLAANETMDMMPAVPPPAPEETPTEPVPALELETTSFTPPEEAPATSAEIQPFDDQLEWGAGDRQSRAIHAEDIAEAESHHEATTSAFEFMASEPPPAPAPEEHHEEQHEEPLAVETTHASATDSTWHAETPAPAPAFEAEPVPADLPLIMPEDVTPADELRRPSSKQVQMVSPEPEEAPAAPELMVTETMGDLYLKQGFKDQAAEVYRRLLRQRPGDPALLAKIAAIESPPAYSASAAGAEPVGSWLRRLARAQLPGSGPAPAPEPEPGPSPMDQAFAAPEPQPEPASEPAAVAAEEPAAVSEGEPARPATDQFSLDKIFGPAPGAPAAASTPAPAPAPTTPLGSSFDEFFGSAPAAETVRPSSEERAPGAPRQSEDDLSAFNAWLHGLKK